MHRRVCRKAVDGAGQLVQKFPAHLEKLAQPHAQQAPRRAVLRALTEIIAFTRHGVYRNIGQHARGDADGVGNAPGAFAGRVADVGRVGFAVAVLVVAPRQANRVLGDVAPGGGIVVAAVV